MPVVAIDGPAGAGKSTTARAVAEALGLGHLDSGALYRALTLAALDTGTPIEDDPLVQLGRTLPVQLAWVDDRLVPRVRGVDVSGLVRGEQVNRHVSAVAALPAVRTWATEQFRQLAARHPRGVVSDGRDVGSVVFPEAALKVFLTASPATRAHRRALDEGRPATAEVVAELERDLLARDRADSGRPVAPLTKLRDAVEVDTTSLDFHEQVATIVALARDRLGMGPGRREREGGPGWPR